MSRKGVVALASGVVLGIAMLVIYRSAAWDPSATDKATAIDHRKAAESEGHRLHSGRQTRTDATDSRDFLDRKVEELAQIESLRDLNGKRLCAADIIRELCAAGYHDAAWRLIDSDAGVVRKAQLAAFFRNAKIDLSEFFELAKSLPYSGEPRAALISRSAGMKVNEISSLLERPDFKGFVQSQEKVTPNFLSSFLGEVLYMRAAFGKKADPERIAAQAEILKHFREGLVDENYFALAFEADSRPPFRKWEIISNMETVDRGTHAGELRKQVIDQMIISDAQRTMELLQQGPEDRSFKDIYWGLRKWTSAEPEDAAAWYATCRAQLGAAERISAVRAFFDAALEAKEYDGALTWAKEVENSEVKAHLLKQLEDVVGSGQ